MAELEERQHGDTGRAREWMTRALHARRDPAWTADGFVSERWMPISPISGRLDAFEWKDPLAGEDATPRAVIEVDKGGGLGDRPVLEAPPPARAASPVEAETPSAGPTRGPEAPAKRSEDREPSDGIVSRETVLTKKTAQPSPLPDASPMSDKPEPEAPPSQEEPSKVGLPQADLRPRRGRSLTPVPVVPALIPLVHAPDDPGPDHEGHVEPEPEPTVEQLPDSWSRIRQLFKP
jgi:HemY protein